MKIRKHLELSVAMLVMLSLLFGMTVCAATPKKTVLKPALTVRACSIRVGKQKDVKVKNAGLKKGQKVTWSTSNKKIATVKSFGKTMAKITAKKSGTCVIKAKISKKNVLQCKVKVLPKKTSGQTKLKTITYSNLTDETSRKLLRSLLNENGIEASRIDALLDRVDKFNGSVKSKWLTNGFETIGATKTKYDVYDMQDEFAAKNGNFMGYNCRLTAFGLMSSYIKTGKNLPATQGKEFLFMDLDTIKADATTLCGDRKERFCAMFAPVKAADSTSVSKQAAALKKGWKARGIHFADSKAHMISVIFHDKYSKTDNTLSVGHVGVMLPSKDGNIYFIEKVAFQEPYRLIQFKNRQEIKDYLMQKYDNSWGQDTAHPFIMENDKQL